MRYKLTVSGIRTNKKAKLGDGGGLWLHRAKTGARYWVYIYERFGRRREMGLGPLADVGLAEARRKADAARAIIKGGGDPFKDLPERQVVMKPKTFGEIADDYIKQAVADKKWKGAKTEAGWRNTMTVHAKPLRKIPVAEITTDDVVRVLRPIWNDRHETATKLRERIATVLDASKVLGLRSGDNPAQWKGHLDKILSTPANGGGHHAAMPRADIASFMKKLGAVDGFGARALEFTILTAARSGETRGATWSEIDLERKLWSIPAERMKAGKQHRVPLTDAACAILKGMASKRMNDLVFPGIRRGQPLSDMTLSKALKAAGGGAFTVHGMRATFRTWVTEETSHPRELAEFALAHAVGDAVERAYSRGDALEKRLALMVDWADFCASGK